MKETELRNKKTYNIDKIDTLKALKIINSEDKKVSKAVKKELKHINEAIDLIVSSFNNGGRLIYIGAGTSGRLGVLDASECLPTFGVSKDQVIGIMAGGNEALYNPSIDSEDSQELGINDVKAINLSSKDSIVGISVSGDASYVIGALKYAKSINANVIALTSNLDAKIIEYADVAIVTRTKQEVITGSTRMKAGTAHKMVLNMLSTMSMVKTNKVISNLMVNVLPTNEKLMNRSISIIKELSDIDENKAKEELLKGKTIQEIIKKI